MKYSEIRTWEELCAGVEHSKKVSKQKEALLKMEIKAVKEYYSPRNLLFNTLTGRSGRLGFLKIAVGLVCIVGRRLFKKKTEDEEEKSENSGSCTSFLRGIRFAKELLTRQ